MVVRHEPWEPGTPAWVDISVTDLERSQAFYGELFGWEFTASDPEYGGYCNAMLDGELVAGMAPPMQGMEEPPHFWTTYLAVADAEEVMGRATAAGAQPVMPPMKIGSFGTMALAADPTGAVFGLWQSDEHTGANRANEPGSLVWSDAMLSDLEAGKQFYADVFGYHYQDVSLGETPYAMAALEPDGRPVCGLGQIEPARPPHWSVNFAVSDADQAVERVRSAGGNVIAEPFDFEFGRMAVLAGPDGEIFSVVSGNPD